MLLVAGCAVKQEGEMAAHEPVIGMLAAPALPDAQRASLERACERWNVLAHHRVLELEGVGERATRIVRPHPFPIDGIAAQAQERPGGVVLVSDDIRCVDAPGPNDPRCVEAVIMHELGHVLGLPHVSRGVMQEEGATLEFTDEDRAACEAAGVCDAT